MEFKEVFPIWGKLKKEEQSLFENNISRHKIKKNEILHRGFDDCIGLVVVISGRFRAYIISDSGREVTLYRLFERDICLLSASCVLSGIQFEISIEAEENSEFFIMN